MKLTPNPICNELYVKSPLSKVQASLTLTARQLQIWILGTILRDEVREREREREGGREGLRNPRFGGKIRSQFC